MTIKIGDISIKDLFLGDKKVIKMYLGENEVYNTSSPTPTDIYDRDGKLYISAGTKLEIRDYSSEGGGTIEYVLPDTVEIDDQYVNITLSDGVRLSANAQLQSTEQYYGGVIKTYYYGGSNTPSATTAASSADVSFPISNYSERQSLPRRYRYGYGTAADASTYLLLPPGIFQLTTPSRDDLTTIVINQLRYYNESYVTPDNIEAVYIHDFGENLPTTQMSNYYVRSRFTSKIGEDDKEGKISKSGSYVYITTDGTQYSNVPIELNHIYAIYAKVKQGVRIGGSTSTYSYFPYSSSSVSYGWGLVGAKVTEYYDTPLNINISGYKFGEEETNVNVSMSVDYPNKRGSVKVNRDIQYYDYREPTS